MGEASGEAGIELSYAGFGIRFFARVLDVLLLTLIINLIYFLDRAGVSRGLWPALPFERAGASGGAFAFVDFFRFFFYMGIHPLYYIVFHYLGGQTPGKMAFSIRVATYSGEGISLSQSALRWLGYILSDITLGIGYLLVVFTRRKQGLHDFVARTVVVCRR